MPTTRTASGSAVSPSPFLAAFERLALREKLAALLLGGHQVHPIIET
jgi:hypothetical protein